MKCAGATIRSSSVRIVFLSIASLNQAGVLGSRNEISQAARPETVLEPRNAACAGAVAQGGAGCGRTVLELSCQLEASGSWITRVCSCRKTRGARRASAVTDGGGHCAGTAKMQIPRRSPWSLRVDFDRARPA